MNDLLIIYHSNSAHQFLTAFGVALSLFTALLLLRRIASARQTRAIPVVALFWQRILMEVIARTNIFFILSLSLLGGLRFLGLSPEIQDIFAKITKAILILAIGIWMNNFVSIYLTYQKRTFFEQGISHEATNLNIIGFIVRLFLWGIILLLIFDNIGINVTALVASLGIGGIAVALAVQNILGDLFASLSIALDKPFAVGDFIAIDSLSGTVRRVGLKTTRIQSVTGEEIVLSNAELLKSRIHNYRNVAERRVTFSFSVTMQTSTEKLQRINEIMRDIIGGLDRIKLERVHFSLIGASSFTFDVVYIVDTNNYMLYMDMQEMINLEMLRRFAQEGISLAAPVPVVQISHPPATVTQ